MNIDSIERILEIFSTKEKYKGGDYMKIFTDEAEDMIVNILGTVIVLGIALLVIGIVGGIEQGLIFP